MNAFDRPEAPLGEVIDLVGAGPWQFLQLRGEPLSIRSIDHGDVDLLGTAESVDDLLSAAFDWVQAGRGHILVRARNTNKLTLNFVSLDARSRITFDLWMTAWQLNGGATALRYADVAHLALPGRGAIRRLPAAIEACIYAHHVHVKEKSKESTWRRLNTYRDACLRDGETEIAEEIGEILKHGKIGPDRLAVFNSRLEKAGLSFDSMPKFSLIQKFAGEFEAARLDGPRSIHHIAITGGDGSGKSSLARELQRNDPIITNLTVGKRLYRNSILYKIVATVARPFLGKDRNKFDDWIAPFAYLRASAALRIKTLLRRSGLGLIDRSLPDFLIVDRKTDNPKLHSASWLSSVTGVRIPVVHLVVPPGVLHARKKELTPLGQQTYDRLIFEQIARRKPTTYAAFFNGADLHSSAEAMSRLLRLIKKAANG